MTSTLRGCSPDRTRSTCWRRSSGSTSTPPTRSCPPRRWSRCSTSSASARRALAPPCRGSRGAASSRCAAAPGPRSTRSRRRRSRGTGRCCTASCRSGLSRGRGTGPGSASPTRSRSPGRRSGTRCASGCGGARVRAAVRQRVDQPGPGRGAGPRRHGRDPRRRPWRALVGAARAVRRRDGSPRADRRLRPLPGWRPPTAGSSTSTPRCVRRRARAGSVPRKRSSRVRRSWTAGEASR